VLEDAQEEFALEAHGDDQIRRVGERSHELGQRYVASPYRRSSEEEPKSVRWQKWRAASDDRYPNEPPLTKPISVPPASRSNSADQLPNPHSPNMH
jgi:hypothetical protein